MSGILQRALSFRVIASSVLTIAVATLASPPTINGAPARAIAPSVLRDVGDELAAGDEVERVLDRRYPRFSSVANCRQVSGRRFTCSYSGSRKGGGRTCFHNGRARVRKVTRFRYRATILTRRVNCF